MEFRALGDLEVVQDGQALALGSHQQRLVLAVLVLSAGEVVSADRLIEALWGERPPATAAKAVQVYISRLRKSLSVGGELIATVDHGYVLRVDAQQVDVRVFERLLDQGRRAYAEREFDGATAALHEALALWRGPALADFTFDLFAAGEITRLEELRLEAVETRIDADLELGRHAAVVAELEVLTAEHPLRERLRAARMLALYRCGREPEALALYRQTRQLLVEELGMEPSQSLRELHEAMLRQDPALAPPAVPRTSPSAARRRVIGGRRRWAAMLAALGLAGGVTGVIALVARNRGASVAVAANSVAVIDPARNAVVGQIGVGVRPGNIASGAGAVWVANLDDNSISEINPTSLKVLSTQSTGRSVDTLAAGDGAVWTVDAAHETAMRIDPVFHDVVRARHVGPDEPGGAIPSPIAVAGGEVWAATGNAAVARLSPRTGRVLTRVDLGNEPAGIAVGDGATWVADDLDDTVSRIDRGGMPSAVPVGRGASAVAVGDGGVWVANTLDSTVTRIDPATMATKATIVVGERPTGIAVGAGSVWVANSLAGTVSRIDPRKDRVTKTIAVGQSPQGVVVAAGRVWITVQAGTPPPTTINGGTLRIAQEKDFNSTDPAQASSYGPQAAQLEFATCAKLLNYPDRPGRVGTSLLPEVATAMPALSADGKTYTFTIRPGFRFSPPSDQPVTAYAFERAIERFLSPQMQPPATGAAYLMDDIVGYGAYRSGRARHIAGVAATDKTLRVSLVRPAPTLPARMAMPFFCAVPPNTPIRAKGFDQIPSAGPYYIASHTPGRELILKRNPSYRGPRTHRLNTIDYRFGLTPTTNVGLVESDRADYANAAIGDPHFAREVAPALQQALAGRYGPRSAAARVGRQRYFINRTLTIQSLLLNTRRPLFARAATRRAANFAVDRRVLARHAGVGFSALPADQYLPPGMPGFSQAEIYSLGAPNVARARRLAGAHHARAEMYTCNQPACLQNAESVKASLRAIGIDVHIRRLPFDEMFAREFTRGEPWDIAFFGWAADYVDPADFIDFPYVGSDVDFPGADEPSYRHRIASAARLTGQQRLRAYGKLDIDIATHAAPIIAFANVTAHDFFSARIGCQTFQPVYGMDLATLCERPTGRH